MGRLHLALHVNILVHLSIKSSYAPETTQLSSHFDSLHLQSKACPADMQALSPFSRLATFSVGRQSCEQFKVHLGVQSRLHARRVSTGCKSSSGTLVEKRCEPCEPTTGSLDYMGLCMALSKQEAEQLLSQAKITQTHLGTPSKPVKDKLMCPGRS